MSEIREAIRKANRLARMRMGQDAPEMAEIPSKPEIRVALVPLNEAETQQGLIEAANLDVPDNMVGITARNRVAVHMDIWNAIRDPEDVSKKVFESVDAMLVDLEPMDIDYFTDYLATLMEYSSPSLDKLSAEALDELKKVLMAIDWSELTGRQWLVLRLCLSVLLPDQLAAKLYGSTSTSNSTTKIESDESI